MMERDIRAVLDGLGLLVQDSKEADKLQAMRNYAAVMALCADLRKSAEEYKGTRNITIVISELENHMAAVAGLFPTWDLPKDQHLVGAHAAISKLTMGTCFGQQSGLLIWRKERPTNILPMPCRMGVAWKNLGCS